MAWLLLQLIIQLTFAGLFAQQTELGLSLDPKTGQYNISVNGDLFLISGDYAFHFNNKWYSNTDGSLQFESYYESEGEDDLGFYKMSIIIWKAGTTSILTTFQNYDPQPFVVFTQVFQGALDMVAVNDEVSSSFPSFSSWNPSLMFLSFKNPFGVPFSGSFDTKSYSGGILGGVPLVLFNSGLDSLVISPFNNFMVGLQGISKTFNQFSCGLSGKLLQIPANYAHQTIITASKGVVKGTHYWGSLLLKHYNKPSTHDGDYSAKYLGYWTDNGAYYYYLTETNKTYEETMVDVYNYINSISLPVQYYQYDSWWYYKGATKGLLLWEPMPSVFPNGMTVLRNKMGNKPIGLHNRWFENDNDYLTKLNYPFVVEKDYAVPSTADPYLYFMSKATDWGLQLYEQDWLSNQYLEMESTQNNVNTAKNWLLGMDQAATKLGISIQMCSALPMHLLQSVMMPSVTQSRASPDYQREVYHPSQWGIAYSSVLLHSLGLFPFKDCFFSSNQTQPGCAQTVCQEINSVLETLVAVLSTGPVAPGDKIGFLDKANLMQTCRLDGLLLKPDLPAQPPELVFSMWFQQQPDFWNLTHTYSQLVFTDNISGTTTELRWHYVLAADTPIPFTIYPKDLDEPGGEFIWFEYFDPSKTLKKLNAATPLVISPLTPTGYLVSFKYHIIFPILSSDYSLIGETNKYTVASKQRFGHILRSEDSTSKKPSTTVKAYGVPGELIQLSMYHATSAGGVGAIEVYSCKVGAQGITLLVCGSSPQSCSC